MLCCIVVCAIGKIPFYILNVARLRKSYVNRTRTQHMQASLAQRQNNEATRQEAFVLVQTKDASQRPQSC